MVHRSIRNGSRSSRRIVYKESVDGDGGFPFLLTLLVLLYSKASYDFETASTLVLSWFPRNEFRAPCPVFRYHILLSISPTPDPARYSRDRVRLEEYLEVVDGRRTRCWDTIHELVNSQPWKCDKVTLLFSSHRELASGGRLYREARRKLTRHSGVNSELWEWMEDKQSWMDTVLGVCWTRCMLYSVSTHDHAMERWRGMT